MNRNGHDRRDPGVTTGTAIKSGYTLEQPKKIRDRTWDKNNPAHSYRIPNWIDEEIDQLTWKNGERLLNKSEVVAFLLEYALEAYKNGDLKIEPRPGRGKFTLFPGE